eukprot:1157890-Pelagomonas_calceolata.AAC.8
MARLVEGMGKIDSPTHTQEDCVESDLSTLNTYGGLGVQSMKLPGWNHAASSFRPILRSTRCEEGEGSLLGFAGQGVTKIAPGRLEVRLA